jgi:hypothetical protein
MSWKATLQPVVASTTDVVYMTISELYKEFVWLKGLFA